MEAKETSEQIRIREISELKNPYDKIQCRNRHLWSEGFRSGYEYHEARLKEITPADIEAWALNYSAFPMPDGNVDFDKEMYDLVLAGAKAMRDGEIKHNEK